MTKRGRPLSESEPPTQLEPDLAEVLGLDGEQTPATRDGHCAEPSDAPSPRRAPATGPRVTTVVARGDSCTVPNLRTADVIDELADAELVTAWRIGEPEGRASQAITVSVSWLHTRAGPVATNPRAMLHRRRPSPGATATRDCGALPRRFCWHTELDSTDAEDLALALTHNDTSALRRLTDSYLDDSSTERN